jgi:hypothetical protein
MRVVIVWAICLIVTFLLFGTMEMGRRLDAIDWQTVSWVASGWTLLSLTALMFTAISAIHKLEGR